ncbi:MAG: tetratricopeptide repeat protein [Ferruginibacter sp.]
MLKHILFFILTICVSHYTNAQISETDSLLLALRQSGEDTSKVKIYGGLARSLRSTDPALAIEYGKKGIQLSTRLGFDKGTAMCYLNVSTAYVYSDKLDTSLIYLDTALKYAHKVGDPNRLGLAYLNRADVYRQLQNITQSLKDCETALKYADEANNDDVRARINQTFGSIYNKQLLYSQSIDYYNKAIILYRKGNNQRMIATVLNNLGIVYRNTGAYAKAIDVTKNAIHILDSLRDITNLSIFNSNLADAYFATGDYEQAENYAAKAMEYAVKQNNESLMALAWQNSGNVYVKQKRYAEAITVLNKAINIFKEDEDIDRINNTADLLAEAYALAGNYSKAYEFMVMSKAANDTVVKQRYDDDIAAMQAKFKVDEKDKEILLLNKDKELQQQKLTQQRFLLFGSLLLIVLSLIGIGLFINRNRMKQRMKELELRNRIAADLHDEVGSSLSSIHMLSQMATQQGNNNTQKDILERMSSNAKETMDKMGDIVWMIKPGETEENSLKQRMERFAYEICSTKNIGIKMELNDLDKCKLSMEQRKNIYLIFKEALNNAVKYSGTEKIEVITAVQNKELLLQVKDFGKGFDGSIAKKGNGLDNMQNRAKELKGKIEIESEMGNGTKVRLLVFNL